ncbi:HNH endonuclease signature motif containing protein [Acidothermaceae bacterium B102]|nr:HNH endonuclease signature motif containing protein [Acidothermaceae bacterium B102]
MFERYAGKPDHFAELAAAIALVPVVPAPGGSAVLAGERLAELIRLSRQLESRVAGHAVSFDRQGFAAVEAATSTAAWLRAHAHMDSQQGHQIVASGRTAEALPLLGKAFADGDIGADHVEAVAAGASGMPLEVLAEHEPTFAQFGGSLRPSELRRVAKRVRSLYDDDMVAKDATFARESRSLHLSESANGIWYLNGQFEAETGAAIKATLDSLTKPLGPTDNRTTPQRRADGLYELTQLALRSGQLPDSGGDRPRLTLTVQPALLAASGAQGVPDSMARRGLADLAGALTGTGVGAAFAPSAVGAFGGRDAHLLGSGALLPAETVERIGCDADVNVCVQAPDGEVLNYGRTRRFPHPVQRRVLVLRDGGCVFPGCDRPPSMCQAHHLRYWSRHGPTDLVNLALVCSFHHHLVHEGQWTLQRVEPGADDELTGGGWRATAPDGREFRRPRRRAA